MQFPQEPSPFLLGISNQHGAGLFLFQGALGLLWTAGGRTVAELKSAAALPFKTRDEDFPSAPDGPALLGLF